MHAATQADKDKIRELDHALQLLQREKERHDKRAQQDQHDNQNTASALQDKLTRAVARGDELQRKLDAAEQRDNEHVRQAALERGKLEQSNSDLQRLQQECHDLRQRGGWVDNARCIPISPGLVRDHLHQHFRGTGCGVALPLVTVHMSVV